jgi:hypothetical protein
VFASAVIFLIDKIETNFLSANSISEFSHSLLTAVSLIPDQAFRSDGCDGVGDHPFSFASQAELSGPARAVLPH